MRRVLTTEWLDLEGATSTEVVDDLRQLRWINRNCGGARLLRRQFDRLLREDGPWRQPVRILDVATGSADLPLALLGWGRSRGVRLSIVAVDSNLEVLRFAREQTRSTEEIRLLRGDARDLPLRPACFDYALCSLFLHQLDDAAGLLLLRALLCCARRAVLINDLVRHPLHYAAAWTLARVLTRNRITRNDAPASVRNAYTEEELLELGRSSGARGVEVTLHAPFRACMVLRP